MVGKYCQNWKEKSTLDNIKRLNLKKKNNEQLKKKKSNNYKLSHSKINKKCQVFVVCKCLKNKSIIL